MRDDARKRKCGRDHRKKNLSLKVKSVPVFQVVDDVDVVGDVEAVDPHAEIERVTV